MTSAAAFPSLSFRSASSLGSTERAGDCERVCTRIGDGEEPGDEEQRSITSWGRLNGFQNLPTYVTEYKPGIGAEMALVPTDRRDSC